MYQDFLKVVVNVLLGSNAWQAFKMLIAKRTAIKAKRVCCI